MRSVNEDVPNGLSVFGRLLKRSINRVYYILLQVLRLSLALSWTNSFSNEKWYGIHLHLQNSSILIAAPSVFKVQSLQKWIRINLYRETFQTSSTSNYEHLRWEM